MEPCMCERLDGIDSETAAQRLRGNAGTTVTVKTAAEDLRNAIQELENQGTLVNTIDKDGNMLPINMVDGHAITHDPLVVIVCPNV
ncbi:hypothetical protein JHK85_004767 [Glycine max]|nr:hypothetical protein JHK85_004767 [Glycine max]